MDLDAWPGRRPGRHALAPGRSGALILLAVLLIAAPEVPVDLGLVGLAGALVFTAAAEVVRLTAR